jgi:hypothetical protein
LSSMSQVTLQQERKHEKTHCTKYAEINVKTTFAIVAMKRSTRNQPSRSFLIQDD